MAFQNSEYGDDSIKKAQNVSTVAHISAEASGLIFFG